MQIIYKENDFDLSNDDGQQAKIEAEIDVINFMKGMTEIQRKILTMRYDQIPKREVMKELGLTESKYNKNMSEIRRIYREYQKT